MDAAQFAQLLEKLSENLAASQRTVLEQILNRQATPSSSETHNNISPFENYAPKNEKFACYIERFENYLAVKNVSDPIKKSQLLNASIGATHYNNLSAFLGPDKPLKDIEYDELVTKFKQMLSPVKNVIVSQHYFLSCYQKDNQTISEFVATLQRNISECDFFITCSCNKKTSISEVFLRAQFVRGIRDNWIREQLLQSEATKFEDLMAKAVALEASRLQSKELMPEAQGESFEASTSHSDMHTVSNFRRRDSFQARNRFQGKSFRQRAQIDYKALGIDDLCFRCGKSTHKIDSCRINREDAKCTSCHKRGHVAKICITTLTKKKSGDAKQIVESPSNSSSEDEEHVHNINVMKIAPPHVIDLYEIRQDLGKYIIEVKIDGKSLEMEVDSGARYSIVSETTLHYLGLKRSLEPTNISFRAFSHDIVPCRGKVKVTVQHKGKEIKAYLYVVSPGHDSLIGRQWIRALDLELKEIDAGRVGQRKISTTDTFSVKEEEIVSEFPNIFEEKIGCIPNIQISLNLRPNAKPVFTRERNIPYALRQRVEKELDTLEREKIITPVATSDWGSPLVVIPKADGGVRLCVDYKCGVNERLISANFPVRKIEDILSNLRDSTYFCKLDLFKAYLHLRVDEESSAIQTISTHRGTYRMNRLSFGIKTAPSEFNRIISQILTDIPNCDSYFDDIIIHGKTEQECAKHLRTCLQRLSEYDLHLNKNKCVFFATEISYLGHIIRENKIMKCPEKIKAVSNMTQPTNVDEVRRFLGMLTYYSRFIPDYSSISYPIRKLLKKQHRFSWTSECEAAFQQLKSEMCSDRVLTPYNPKLPIVLTTDASPVGVAAILSHSVNNEERPIAYVSRSLTESEMNYSQLDREALAIIFAVSRFYNYVYGRHFYLVTDNAPLSRIFAENRSLPQMTSARLLRYASFLSGFDYTLKCKKGKNNENVDCLSRAPLHRRGKTMDMILNEEVNQLYTESVFLLSNEVVTAVTIANETLNDPDLQKILKDLRSKSKDSPYTISEGILFKNDRVVVPKKLRPSILCELHATHLGITKMKQLARRYVFWEGIDREIEHLVKSCVSCALVQNCPPKVTVHPWDDPENNWERIHIDYAGPVDSKFVLVCVDAKSKWLETRVLKTAPTSSTTVNTLNDIFSFHGYPETIVSDNATIFKSKEFIEYCQSRGISQKWIAPWHPATNGLAERNVQTVKKRLEKANNDVGTLKEKLRKIVFRHRATPLANGRTPAELYLHRKIRIKLDAIFPRKLQKPTEAVSRPDVIRYLLVGERIQTLIHKGNKDVWMFGVVKERLGSRHYLVKLDNGRELKRHINQTISTKVPLQNGENQSSPKSRHMICNIPKSTLPPTPADQNPIQMEAVLEPPAPDVNIPVAPDIQDPARRSQRTRRPPKHLMEYELL